MPLFWLGFEPEPFGPPTGEVVPPLGFVPVEVFEPFGPPTGEVLLPFGSELVDPEPFGPPTGEVELPFRLVFFGLPTAEDEPLPALVALVLVPPFVPLVGVAPVFGFFCCADTCKQKSRAAAAYINFFMVFVKNVFLLCWLFGCAPAFLFAPGEHLTQK